MGFIVMHLADLQVDLEDFKKKLENVVNYPAQAYN